MLSPKETGFLWLVENVQDVSRKKLLARSRNFEQKIERKQAASLHILIIKGTQAKSSKRFKNA